ncbi:MAG: HlyD family secretion protein [Anaerolineales bacterium]
MKKIPFIISIFIILLFLSGCNSKSSQDLSTTPTSIPLLKSDAGTTAEGKIVPLKSIDLSFQFSGKVIEVLVKEGDNVKKGDVIARLGDREQVETEVANAEVNLVNAQQGYDNLYKNHSLDLAQAMEAVAKANSKVRDAQYQLDNFTIPVGQQNLSAIDAIKMTQEKLDQARKAFEPYKNDSLYNDEREKLKEALDNAQADYNAAVKRLNYEVQLQYAQAELQLALENWKNLQNGPDPEQLKLATSRLSAAKTALQLAQAHLNSLELKSPIDGVVAKLNLVVGDQVTPNMIVATIADFSTWLVETDNLTEIEVVNVQNGQQVSVVPDALPNVTLTGVVDTISPIYEEKRGDITYTARIKLLDNDPNLRWGMTVLVTFK